MKKKFASFIFAFMLCTSLLIVPSFAEDTVSDPATLVQNAQAVYMVNLDTDTPMTDVNKNEHERRAPASTTKIMTAVIVLEQVKNIDSETVTIQSYMLDEFQNLGYTVSNAALTVGEEIAVRDLLYGLMLQSACDGANALAGYVGDGSIASFVDQMNAKAEELGLSDTHFENAHGLDQDNHYSSAYDLAKLTEYAMDLPYFMEISSAIRWNFTTNLRTDTFATTNCLTDETTWPALYYAYAKGIKTGTTEEAGSCLVSTATKENVSYLLVVLGAPDKGDLDAEGTAYTVKQAFPVAKSIYQWAFDSFSIKSILEEGKLVQEVPLKMAWGKDTLQLKTNESVSYLVANNVDTSSALKKFYLPDYVNAPIEEGQVVGYMEILLTDEVVATVPLVSAETVEQNGLLYVGAVFKNAMSSVWFKLSILSFVLAILCFIAANILLNHYRKTSAKINRANRRPRR